MLQWAWFLMEVSFTDPIMNMNAPPIWAWSCSRGVFFLNTAACSGVRQPWLATEIKLYWTEWKEQNVLKVFQVFVFFLIALSCRRTRLLFLPPASCSASVALICLPEAKYKYLFGTNLKFFSPLHLRFWWPHDRGMLIMMTAALKKLKFNDESSINKICVCWCKNWVKIYIFLFVYNEINN